MILILCLLLDQGRIGAVLLTNSSAEWGNLNLVIFVVGVQSSFVAQLMVTSSNKLGAASFGRYYGPLQKRSPQVMFPPY